MKPFAPMLPNDLRHLEPSLRLTWEQIEDAFWFVCAAFFVLWALGAFR